VHYRRFTTLVASRLSSLHDSRHFTTLVSCSHLASSLLSSTLCSDGPRWSAILFDLFVLRSLCDPLISDSLFSLPPFLECIAP